jgi:hypothetical protein
MDELGVKDPEYEFNQWLEERQTILSMNKELNAKSVRSRVRERDSDSPVEGIEEPSS